MGIEKIDKNFDLRTKIAVGDVKVYDIPSQNFALYGVYFEERANAFVRMDTSVAETVSDGVGILSRHTSGGRLCFATDSTTIKIAVEYPVLCAMPHMTLVGSSGFSLFEETDEGERHIANFAPLYTDLKGFSAGANLSGGKMRKYILYFPLYNQVDRLSIALDKNAEVVPEKPYRDLAPILYYGSSITQGGCANRSDHAYQTRICKRNKIDFINLGFSGAAKAEKEMIAYLSAIKCSLFVCDYDHNAPTAAYLQETHYPLYEAYRKQNPTTPILFISRPDPYRGNEEGLAREKIVRGTYQKAKRNGDKNVYFLSGKSFFGKKGSWNFAVDGCHPTDHGFAVMADKIYKKMLEIDEKFGGGKDD